MKKVIFYVGIITFLLTASGCKKSLLDIQNKGAYTYDTYFATDAVLNQAVVATYATMLHQGMWSREYYFIFDLMGYEAKSDAALQGGMLALAQFTFGPESPELQQFWASFYRMVLRANVVIDRTTIWEPTTPGEIANKKQYLAEAKFLRAFAYFNLVNTYGRVPLRTSFSANTHELYPSRASVAEIWASIEMDLKDAAADLPVQYPADQLGRVTKGAAVALLGKSYLYQKKWPEAQSQFTLLTQSPFDYKLAPNYLDLFSNQNQSNPETIFQVMHQKWTDWGIGNQYYMFTGQEFWGNKATHSGRAQEYGFNDWKNVYITTTAVEAFTYPNPANGSTYKDPRAKFTFYGDAASGGQTQYCQQCPGGAKPFEYNDPATGKEKLGYRWLKYEYYNEVENYGGPQSGINSQLIRYADVKLMLAEAYIQQGVTGAVPLGLINDVRARSGAVAYPTLGTQANAMTILMRERQLEFTGEQLRWFDLIRWGIAKQTINAERLIEDGTQPLKDKNLLFPIPLDEKSSNPNVAGDIQNDWN
ncbi:MAG: RagB/SusD family nutrient uptake outer membrane protein [Ginsengibacter sp.]